MNEIDVLILDDQTENNELLKEYIQLYCKNINAIYTSTTVDEAILLYLTKTPRILLLDIQLDYGLNSFDFLKRISTSTTEIIFITSHEQYALKAINEVSAVAYLIKPVKPEELVTALNKAVRNLGSKTIISLETAAQSLAKYDVLSISLRDRVVLMKQNEIVYLEADGKYTNFIMADKINYRSSKNIGEYIDFLDPSSYFRIHSKYIVNLNYVTNINKAAGNYCELKDLNALPISKRRQKELYEFLNLRRRLL
jgi:two-component system LytT family response regulator